MQSCPLRPAARQCRELRNGTRSRWLAQRLYAAAIGAARRLDCFGLEPLLGAIPDSNDDFVFF